MGKKHKKKFLAAELPDPGQPKAPSKNFVIPNYLGKAKGAKIPNSSINTTNLSLSAHVRSEASINSTIKKLVLSSPDLSHALETKIRTAIPQEHRAVAYKPDATIDEAATKMLQAFIMRLDLGSYDYTQYTATSDLRSLASSLLLDDFRYGAMCAELVCGSTRLPAYISPVPVRLLEWGDATPNRFPIYKGKGGDVPLNYPTIFYSSSIQDGETPYSDSPLQASIQACLWDADFVDALRRAAVKNLLQRMVVTINSEKFMQTLSVEQQTDKAQLQAAMDATSDRVEEMLSNLEPDDALVLFDILEADTIADKNRSEDRTMTVLHDIINGKIATGAKILPSIIGRGESSNAASTESALFLKAVSSVQDELNILLSRAFSLALRLLGFDCYAWFHFDEINLRPALELESFKAIRQSTLLEQLSLGMRGDTETVIELTGSLPPAGYVELCGTGFMTKKPDVSGNDYSNTSVSADGKPDSTQSQKDGEVKTKGVKSKK